MFKREYFFQSPVVDDLRNQVKHEGHNQQTAQPAQAAYILPFEYLRFVDAQISMTKIISAEMVSSAFMSEQELLIIR